MKEVRLIPEQVKTIENDLAKLERRIAELKEAIAQEKVFSGSHYSYLHEMSIVMAEAKGIREKLRHAIIISDYEEDKIEIGTRFVATLNYGDAGIVTKECVLIDDTCRPSVKDVSYISINSPFGKAVYHKSEEDAIQYVTPRQLTVTGVIERILPASSKEASVSDNEFQYRK